MCWQSDITHFVLADGTEVEIINFEDDHSRLCIDSKAFGTVKGHDVVDVFRPAALTWGYPPPSSRTTDHVDEAIEFWRPLGQDGAREREFPDSSTR